MAKPRVVTALQIWMLETGRTDTSLAKEISALHPDKPITDRQVARWRKGSFTPRAFYMGVLKQITGGRVDANSFFAAKNKEPPDGSRSGQG